VRIASLTVTIIERAVLRNWTVSARCCAFQGGLDFAGADRKRLSRMRIEEETGEALVEGRDNECEAC